MSSRAVSTSLLPAEQQEFQDCCERQWYNRKEFEISCVETENGRRSVAVARNGNVKCYTARVEHSWLAEFDYDLAEGRFGV